VLPLKPSTGEALGIASSFGLPEYKAEEAMQQLLPTDGMLWVTVSPKDRLAVFDAAKLFTELGFKIKVTQGPQQFLASRGINADFILKKREGRPNILDAIKKGDIQLVVNTPSGKFSQYDDSYIRKAAIQYKVSYIITTLAATSAAAQGNCSLSAG
jgi:carbamoyl-phosphate synthase large subunit